MAENVRTVCPDCESGWDSLSRVEGQFVPPVQSYKKSLIVNSNIDSKESSVGYVSIGW